MKTLLIALTFLLNVGLINSTPTEHTTTFKSIPLTLKNNSLQSIPLKIPGYMNPNLSPMSTSGVDLKIGQEVYFQFKGKKRVLLTVTEDLAGQTLIVNELIKERQKEILAAKNKKS